MYRAEIAPGEETLFHRRDHDAPVASARGGVQSNSVIGPSRADRFVFPCPAGIFGKLRAGISSLLTGSIRFRTGAFFATLYTGHPIIHKIAASSGNDVPIKFLDIRASPSEGTSSSAAPALPRGARLRLQTDQFVAYTARALPGSRALAFKQGCPALVISLEGRQRLCGARSADLEAGGFLALSGGERIELACASGRAVRALFLMPKPAKKESTL
ncbi:MAG: hypothetical protein JXD23_00420 [Spirochaetales bacterium]|nr:hypothetical protein [Spirochaetales bacterium]